MEFSTITRVDGKVVFRNFAKPELEALLKTVNFEQAQAGDI